MGHASLALCVAVSLTVSGTAYATPVEDARAKLDAAEESMARITEEYDALVEVVDDLQARIDETAQQALEAQNAYLEGREDLGKTAVFSYMSGSPLRFLDWLFQAASITELLKTADYIDCIMTYQADAIERQRANKLHFDAVSEELNRQKNDQEDALARLAAKKDEAQSVVDEASETLSDAEADEARRLAELQRRASALEREDDSIETDIDPDADTTDRKDVVETPTVPETPSNPSTPSAPSEESPSGQGWLTGVASAYGGSTDPYTPNPGTTATGAVCDDNSMGVAVPTSLPNYKSYLGRTVEISYNGMTVYATVNDTGYMGGGSRALDLQPGVWKAFGFSSCLDWGVRTVSYRFL